MPHCAWHPHRLYVTAERAFAPAVDSGERSHGPAQACQWLRRRGRAGIAIFAGCPAAAQTLADLATYSGPDRTQQLIDGAKKEGAVTLYSSATIADQTAIASAFQAKYGIKVQQWRGSSEDIRHRAMTEYRAGRYDVDVAETAGPDMEAMVREKLLQPVNTPVSAELIPQATLQHHEWVRDPAQRLRRRLQHQHHQAGRRAEELRGPARSEMEGQARHRGRRRQLVPVRGRLHGRGQGPEAVPRHRRQERHVDPQGPHAAGELRRLRRGAARAHRLQLPRRADEEVEGAPVERSLPAAGGRAADRRRCVQARRRIRTRRCCCSISILTDAQKILAEREACRPIRKVRAPPKDMIFVDLPKFLDEGEKWTKLFKETFATRRAERCPAASRTTSGRSRR